MSVEARPAGIWRGCFYEYASKKMPEIVPASSQGLVLCLIDMAKDDCVLEIGFGPTEWAVKGGLRT